MSIKIFSQVIICFVTICLADLSIAKSEENNFPYFCELKISYYPGEDGQAYERFHRENVYVRGKTKIYHGEHPSHGPYTQLGVKLIAEVCYKNEHTGQVYVNDPEDFWIKSSDLNIQEHENSLTDFIFVFLDDYKTEEQNNDCNDKWWTSFEEGKRVIIKVADIWQGMTAHYSTTFAIAPEDIMIDAKWICS